jgi:hypothetical protein
MNQRGILKTIFLSVFITFCISGKAVSQNTPSLALEKIHASDFELPKSKIIDDNSNAVIISDIGSIEFISNKYNLISYVFKKKTLIKILNKKGYDMATVRIRLFGEKNKRDELDEFHASTFNIDNGLVTEEALTSNNLFDEKIGKYILDKKFTMPHLKEGSIIEYTYTITSYHYSALPLWLFQNLNSPCLYSEFKIGIPDMVRYLTIRYGTDSFYSIKADVGYKYLQRGFMKLKTSIHNFTWVMKDIPAFRYEDYINEPTDYLDRIEFTPAHIFGEDLNDVLANWMPTEVYLLQSIDFGRAINFDHAFNLHNIMEKVCLVNGDIESDARQIFFYIRDNFTCIPDDQIYIANDLYDVNKHHKGSVSELNMLLIALLRQRGIEADPVILSTREYGLHPVRYPVLEKMNYVICMMHIGSKKIFLDATDPLLGFGKLPLSCYNGHAQIIDERHSGSLFFNANDIKEQNKTYVTLVNEDKKGIGVSGALQSTFGYFASYDLRKMIKVNGEEGYLKTIRSTYGADVVIDSLHIDSLKQLENPVTVNYDLSFKYGNDKFIYFNPVISGSFKENPFTATERKYPIELPYPIDDIYEMSMEIPKGYRVDEMPKSAKVSLNGSDGFFDYTIQKDESLVQLRTHLKLNQSIFRPEDYSSLRDFFAYVIKKQSEQIVFKKK